VCLWCALISFLLLRLIHLLSLLFDGYRFPLLLSYNPCCL
ncbi:unnamed protein product, partial [Brassica rapa]